MNDDDILFDIRDHAGLVTLNRPKALNALTHGMVTAFVEKLEEWREEDAVRCVVVRAAGEKAFCAGGDIRRIYDQGTAGDPAQVAFFADEYRLNVQIKRYPKPYVALIDGIVMGGGVGVSVHGSHRVGTERTVFAMPETGIGFFPDVGGTYFLPRMPHQSGMMAALTATRLKQADALWTGVLTHAVMSSDLDALTTALCEGAQPDEVLAAFARTATDLSSGEAPLSARATICDEVFGKASLQDVLAALQAAAGGGDDGEWAAKQLAAIRSKSPTSLSIAFAQLRKGADLDFEACMRLEHRIVSHILKGHDFYEGVRAVIVDKDNTPKWSPERVADVQPRDVERYFQLPDGGDLDV
ncbi:enoyl-CoA hydratase/isomerase family protein [Stappia sp. ES.058]|uniref:enoyl-CoA hydratase/isomerase family protein n=1 Tax=Stappia sp. ES.058 TaxID=1881061 RepID=UPI00087D7A08|nr:enoyl-CoA hydratase/isomerase family protein [Stappia sp. ES.058]SDU06083.1 3-hydroxyisobutyryl-CoA hydrolase [Stappia sp. ES.058]